MNHYIPKTFTLPSLEGISEKTIETHLKLYEGYVKHVNLILEKIEEYCHDSEKNAYVLGELQRRFSFEFDGMRNHEYYFGNFEGGPTAIASEYALFKAIERDFGFFDNWFKRFSAIATTRGIGWAMLYYDSEADRLVNGWVDEQHLGHLTGLTPIVALDMWEHSYLIDYTPAEKTKYIEAFFNNFNWHKADELFEKVQKNIA